VHFPVAGSYNVGKGTDDDTSESPAGSRSVTTTPVAWLGPLFDTLMNTLTVSPTSAEVGWTFFDTATSAFALTEVGTVAVFPGGGGGVLVARLAVCAKGLGVV